MEWKNRDRAIEEDDWGNRKKWQSTPAVRSRPIYRLETSDHHQLSLKVQVHPTRTKTTLLAQIDQMD